MTSITYTSLTAGTDSRTTDDSTSWNCWVSGDKSYTLDRRGWVSWVRSADTTSTIAVDDNTVWVVWTGSAVSETNIITNPLDMVVSHPKMSEEEIKQHEE